MVQSLLPVIEKDTANPFYKSMYATLDGIYAVLIPILTSQGLVLSLPLTNIEGKPAIALELAEAESGEMIREVFPLIEKDDAQKQGSVITYTKRQFVASFFAIQLGDDDDGNTASDKQAPKAPVSAPQAPQSTTTAKCDKCAAPMKISSAGKPYCSKLCWKNPPQPLPVIQQETPLEDIPF